jgi:hypothetical protein
MFYTREDYSLATSRQPRILGRMKVKKNSFHDTLLRQASRYWLGSVHTAYPNSSDPTLGDLRKACSLHGFAFKDNSDLYYFSDYVYGAGSVSPHKDSGFGFAVGVLVATRPLSKSLESDGEECFLFTKGKILSITVGEVFLFDSDAEHAWMANCRWLIATQSVKLKRVR